MKILADGFLFDFTDAIDVFIFDEKDKSSPHFHGLSHAMQAVDLIVELEQAYLFIEIKDFHAPDDYDFKNAVTPEQRKGRLDFFNHLRNTLKSKFRDTCLYRWAENKIDKPVHYLCLLTLDNGLLSVLKKELWKQLPVGVAGPRWTREFAKSCVVVNLSTWNSRFPKWPVTRLDTPGGA